MKGGYETVKRELLGVNVLDQGKRPVLKLGNGVSEVINLVPIRPELRVELGGKIFNLIEAGCDLFSDISDTELVHPFRSRNCCNFHST